MRKSVIDGFIVARTSQKVAMTRPHMTELVNISIVASDCSSALPCVAAISPYPIEVIVIIDQ